VCFHFLFLRHIVIYFSVRYLYAEVLLKLKVLYSGYQPEVATQSRVAWGSDVGLREGFVEKF
jgi:hypothetical protein